MPPNQISVNPPSLTMLTAESLPLSFDPSPLLEFQEVPIAPTSTLVDITDPNHSVPISLTDAPVMINGKVIQQIRGTELTAAHTYTLTVTVSIQGSLPTKTWAMVLTILCPT